ncbi:MULTISPECIES: MarR family transcriptional regulator [Haloarcula]|uniref:MarR family transcriptional regulator n=1 Tax=Haloarcula TaxID=2237 RepID=UPI001580C563|nr:MULTISPECIES: MarR family transcriptional regulator [Haloarcula]
MENDDGHPDWLTEMDKEIINVLGTNLTLTPSIIAENIDRSREGVGNRLNSLQAGGLVRKVDRGKYEITEEGLKYMTEWVDVDDEYKPWHGKTREEIKKEIEERNSDTENE